MDTHTSNLPSPGQLENGITQDLLNLFEEQGEDVHDLELLRNDLISGSLFESGQLHSGAAGNDTIATGAATPSTGNKDLSAGPSSRPGSKRAAPSKRESKHRIRDNDKLRELEAVAAAKLEQYMTLTRRNADLKLRNTVLSEALLIRDVQLSTSAGKPLAELPLPPELQAATSIAAAARLPGSMKLINLQAPEQSVEAVRAMGPQQLLDQHQRFLTELSAPLLALEDNPADEGAAEAIRAVLVRVSALFRTACVVAPEPMTLMMQTHMETREVGAAPPGHWAAVMQKLEMTPQQVTELSAMWGLFRGVMDKVQEERRALNARLTEGLAQQEHKEAQRAAATAAVAAQSASTGVHVNGGSFGRHASGGGIGGGVGGSVSHHQLEVPPEAEVLPALSRNLRKESAAHLLLRGFLFGRTLSILQAARVMVHSYPWFPNATALTAVAAGVPDYQ